MKNNNSDVFEISKKKFYLADEVDLSVSSNNFFINEHAHRFNDEYITEPSKRINDYDSNLLEENAYKDVDDELLKLEYRIHKLEDELKNIDIETENAFFIKDYNLYNELVMRKKSIASEYDRLIVKYNNGSVSSRVTELFSKIFFKQLSKIFKSINGRFVFLFEKCINILPVKFTAFLELKKSLNYLEYINKNVDELVTRKLPYNDNSNKYEQLSQYIIKANSIQNEINGFYNKK